jgi:hypothetical protein
VNHDSHCDRRHVKRDLAGRGNDRHLDEGRDNKQNANERIDEIIESKLLCGYGELRIDRLKQKEVEPTGADELGQIGQVHVKESLKDLGDELMSSDQHNDLPFRPVSNPVHITEDDLDENDLSDEPQQLDSHPKQEVCLESHFADHRVAEHDGIDLSVPAQS